MNLKSLDNATLFRRIIKKAHRLGIGPRVPKISRIEGKLLWYNELISVVDDPLLENLFGRYVLDEIVREGENYALDVNGGNVRITEHLGKIQQGTIDFLNRNYSSHPDVKKLITGSLIIHPDNPNKYNTFIELLSQEISSDYIFVNELPYRYLEGVGFDRVSVKSDSTNPIFFSKNDTTIGFIAPVSPEYAKKLRSLKESC